MMMNIIRTAITELDKNENLQTNAQDGDQDTDQVSDQVKALLSCFGNSELSALELMRKLGLSHRPTFRKNYLNPALSKGLIEMTIPDKPNSRNQKYRKK